MQRDVPHGDAGSPHAITQVVSFFWGGNKVSINVTENPGLLLLNLKNASRCK